MEIAFKLSVDGTPIEYNLEQIYNEFIAAIAVDKFVELVDKVVRKDLLKVVPTSLTEFVLVVDQSTDEVPDHVILMVYTNEGAYFPEIVLNARAHKSLVLGVRHERGGPTKRSRKNQCRDIILEIAQRGCSSITELMQLAYKLEGLNALPDVAYEAEAGEQQAESQDCAIETQPTEGDGNLVPAEEYIFDVERFKEEMAHCRPENFYALVADFVRPVRLFRKKFKSSGNGLYHNKLGEVFALPGFLEQGIGQLYMGYPRHLSDESPETKPVAIGVDSLVEFIVKGMTM
jgi:hypothetical protein